MEGISSLLQVQQIRPPPLLSSSVPPYGLIGRTSSSAPFRFSSVDNRHADEAQACRRRRVFERRPFCAKGCNPLTPAGIRLAPPTAVPCRRSRRFPCPSTRARRRRARPSQRDRASRRG